MARKYFGKSGLVFAARLFQYWLAPWCLLIHTAARMPPIFDAHVQDIAPDCRLLFKPVDNATSAGCHLDVWLPENKPAFIPLMILIHGGAFTHGSTKDIGFHQIKWLNQQGVAAVSLEYRMLPQVTLKEIRSDLLDAYIYIQTRLNDAIRQDKPQSPHIDTTRCAVTGGSAGGSATLWLCADVARYNNSATTPLPRIRAALPAYCSILPRPSARPRSDIYSVREEFGSERFALVEALFKEKVCCSDPYQFNVLDKHPPMKPRNQWVVAAMKTGVLSSYLHGCDPPFPEDEQILSNITRDFPPTLMYVALEDDLIPPHSQKHALETKLGELGVECKVLMVQAPHGFIDLPARYFPDRAQGWWDETVQPALTWALTKMNE